MIRILIILFVASFYVANNVDIAFVDTNVVASIMNQYYIPYSGYLARFMRIFLIDTYIGSVSIIFDIHGFIINYWYYVHNCVDVAFPPLNCGSAWFWSEFNLLNSCALMFNNALFMPYDYVNHYLNVFIVFILLFFGL